MRPSKRARWIAGAFLFLSASLAPMRGEQIRIAAQRPDDACPAGGPPFGIRFTGTGFPMPEDPGGCVWSVSVGDLGDEAIRELASRLVRLQRSPAVVLELSGALKLSPEEQSLRIPYAVKQLSSAARAGSPDAEVFAALPRGLGVPADTAHIDAIISSEELEPYLSGLIVGSMARSPETIETAAKATDRRFALGTTLSKPGRALEDVLNGIRHAPNAVFIGASGGQAEGVTEPEWQSLQRLQRYLTPDVSRDPTATRATRADGSEVPVARFFDAKAFTPILLLSSDPAGTVRIALTGGPFARASVENLASGARRDFEIGGAGVLTLNLAQGALAARLIPVERPDAARTRVDVGAERGLTAEEIVARERAWEAGQRDAVSSFLADMDTSLRFRVAEVNETFDLTIRGPFFYRRGEAADWAWHEFYLNGVKWKGKTLPKIPILQPEKVTTLPLDIRLTEEYDYRLSGDGVVDGRPVYVVQFTPKQAVGDRPIYRGTAWIDKESFALKRRESIQLNLKGETLSNIQNEYYRPVPDRPDAFLPLEIRGQQVFSTAGRTTAIERQVTMTNLRVNPADFEERRVAEHASASQMVRDTDKGLRYLIPDPARPETRIVEENVSRKSTFGLLGGFYDDSLDYPLPLLGLQHFNFDLWGKGKQLTVFFGGALLTGNYTDPSLFGSRFDLGADVFGVAFPFGDPSYRGGEEIPEEKVQRLPAVVQVNVGRPLGPYLKTSLGLFTRWDNYQRHEDTGSDFLIPTDTLTSGAELRLVANVSGFNASLEATYARRHKWEEWGTPGGDDWDPRHRDFFQYQLVVSKDHYFRGFRKLHVGLRYLGGQDLDRFSKYEFGTFSSAPLKGFKSGSIKAAEVVVANLSYGLNIQEIIRFEAFYDQAYVLDEASGFGSEYFSGAGLLASFNAPWKNSLLRAEVGVPVVSHGISGFVVSFLLLKLF
ncbi:MAG: hypothetical protein ABR576_06285 [Thermoanaerobaculia bacterium]